MDINAQIIDQRVGKLAQNLSGWAGEELGIADEGRLRSLAFLHLCVTALLDLNDREAFDCLTEGGGDLGADAVHIGDEHDGEFVVTLFQAKYRTQLRGDANFPATGLRQLTEAVRIIFDPRSPVGDVNERLRAQLEEVRSLIRDGLIPRLRLIACTNGAQWQSDGDEIIERFGHEEQVEWEFVNHDRLVSVLQATRPVNETLQLTGTAIVEDLDFKRVLVGRASLSEIARLMGAHGERLLDRNIRRYLGLNGNRVNEAMRDTIRGEERKNFYVYNNGVTLICDSFTHNGLQNADFKINARNLQIINGGQTCMTIWRVMSELSPTLFDSEEAQGFVMVRLYAIPGDEPEHDGLVRRVTLATNSQNPVDLRDLRANDPIQVRLETDVAGLNSGLEYRRKRASGVAGKDITAGVAAEAVLSVWRQRPHQAKFFAREHFGKLYDTIFTDDLTGTEVILGVQLYRIAENRRRRPAPNDPPFVRYASCFLAMQMGRKLLKAMGREGLPLTHRDFAEARALVTAHSAEWFSESVAEVGAALRELYGDREIGWQLLSATFRRGDLIDLLAV